MVFFICDWIPDVITSNWALWIWDRPPSVVGRAMDGPWFSATKSPIPIATRAKIPMSTNRSVFDRLGGATPGPSGEGAVTPGGGGMGTVPGAVASGGAGLGSGGAGVPPVGSVGAPDVSDGFTRFPFPPGRDDGVRLRSRACAFGAVVATTGPIEG